MSKTYIWPVSGMHCASCEGTISRILQKLPGVEEVDVRLKQQRAGVRLADGAPEPDLVLVNQELAAFGYQMGEKDQTQAACVLPGAKPPLSKRVWQAFLMLGIVGAVGAVLIGPVMRLVPMVSASSSLGALLAFGVVASFSTCLASTGAYILAYTAESKSHSKMIRLHIGRLVTFVVGGALLGAVGGALPSQTWLYSLVALILGVGFLFVGLNLLDLFPSLASLGLHLPSASHRWIDRIAKKQGGVAPFFVGALTFILPCGFTQTAQALALASGSAERGALMMLAFGLGTLPVLLGVSFFGSAATLRHRFLRLATGAVLVLFAVGQVDGGLTVLGSPITFGGAMDRVLSVVRSPLTVSPAQASEQVVDMTVAYGAFSPRTFTIKRGVPVRWNIDGVDISGCASTIISPKIGLTKTLIPGLNIVQFTPKQTGIIPFSCSMGMIRGSFTVVD